MKMNTSEKQVNETKCSVDAEHKELNRKQRKCATVIGHDSEEKEQICGAKLVRQCNRCKSWEDYSNFSRHECKLSTIKWTSNSKYAVEVVVKVILTFNKNPLILTMKYIIV
jgi:hypothetical protein